jgi:hypothetical protein
VFRPAPSRPVPSPIPCLPFPSPLLHPSNASLSPTQAPHAPPVRSLGLPTFPLTESLRRGTLVARESWLCGNCGSISTLHATHVVVTGVQLGLCFGHLRTAERSPASAVLNGSQRLAREPRFADKRSVARVRYFQLRARKPRKPGETADSSTGYRLPRHCARHPADAGVSPSRRDARVITCAFLFLHDNCLRCGRGVQATRLRAAVTVVAAGIHP